MTKKQKLFTCLCLFFLCSSLNTSAQVFDRRGQTIYVEFIGQGLFYSLNYETRFSEKTHGLGGRVGIGYLDGFTSIPLNVNYLIGKKERNHFLEIGAGATFMFYKDAEKFGDKEITKQTMIAGAIGYRYHPRLKKFVFRFTITPMYGYWDSDDETKKTFPLFGLSFGRAF